MWAVPSSTYVTFTFLPQFYSFDMYIKDGPAGQSCTFSLHNKYIADWGLLIN